MRVYAAVSSGNRWVNAILCPYNYSYFRGTLRLVPGADTKVGSIPGLYLSPRNRLDPSLVC
jgi:hypothetical protein